MIFTALSFSQFIYGLFLRRYFSKKGILTAAPLYTSTIILNSNINQNIFDKRTASQKKSNLNPNQTPSTPTAAQRKTFENILFILVFLNRKKRETRTFLNQTFLEYGLFRSNRRVVSQPVITCSIETVEQGVKYLQS